MMIRAAADAMKAANRLTVACHLKPDGDALGSMLGLALALEAMGKEVIRLCQDTPPEAYTFLPGADRIRQSPPANWQPDVSVALDCESASRLGTIESVVMAAPIVIDIDHHAGYNPFGHIQVLDPTAAATSQQVCEFIPCLDVPLTRELAVCLLAGIIFDTGAFRFSNTTPRTFSTAATLCAAGAEPDMIHRRMFDERPVSALRLLGIALRAVNTRDGIAFSLLTREDFERAGARDSETEGIINQLMSLRDIEGAVLVYETAEGSKVSLRSREGLDVAAVAREFGGGGHVKAAGCTIKAPAAEALQRVLSVITTALSDGAH